LGSPGVRVRAMYTLGIHQFASIHQRVQERARKGPLPDAPVSPGNGDD